MKFDKDTLIKQRFWFLLAVSVPLALVGLFLLSSSVPAQIGKERKAVDTVLKELKGFADPKSPEFVRQAEKKAAEKEKEKTIVWRMAAGEQSDLMTWPDFVEKKYHFRDGLFAKEITATRSKEEPKTDQGQAPKNDASHFHGTITTVNQDWLMVNGKQRFERSPDVKVQITGAEGNQSFSSLRAGDRVAITFEKGKYFGDKLTENERTDYARTYKSQLLKIIAQVMPLSDKGEGVVQFPGWVWNGEDLPPKGARYFRYVADEWKQDLDFSDEAWMAQEDLWVTNEIYRLVRVANDSVAQFKGQGGPDKDKDYDFTNPYWHLKCRVTADGKLKVTIRNLQDQRQELDVKFKFKLAPERTKELTIEGVARAPAGTTGDTLEATFTTAQLGLPPKGVYGVEQVLTWKTAAVKRIDLVSIGCAAVDENSESHRQCALPLKTLRPEVKKEEAAPDPNVPGGRRRIGNDPTASGLTPNGLIPDRYLDATPQARRVPVGVVLIVDQQHVERVQAAFGTSKLRFLTTQVVLNRYPYSLRPQEAGDPAAGAPGNAVARLYRPMMPPGGFRGGGVVGQPGGGNRAGANAGGGDEQESNVELVLYGIVSMYERFPPRTTGPGN